MSFGDYANYYDILYKDKDYKAESSYVEKILKKHTPFEVKTILNLGSGTGAHDSIFAEKGYQVTGVDMSETMLAIAQKKLDQYEDQVRFVQGDLRTIRLKKKFDAVVSLFNVMGYQITNPDFAAAIATARAHLKKQGLFVFDCWFGPAVIVDPPKSVTKKMIHESVEVIRKTESSLDPLQQTITINFDTLIREGKKEKRVNETHEMRFFFYQELLQFLESGGFKVINIHRFMELSKKPDLSHWNITVVAQRI